MWHTLSQTFPLLPDLLLIPGKNLRSASKDQCENQLTGLLRKKDGQVGEGEGEGMEKGRDTEGSDEFVLIRERKEDLSQIDSEALPGAQRQVT